MKTFRKIGLVGLGGRSAELQRVDADEMPKGGSYHAWWEEVPNMPAARTRKPGLVFDGLHFLEDLGLHPLGDHHKAVGASGDKIFVAVDGAGMTATFDDGQEWEKGMTVNSLAEAEALLATIPEDATPATLLALGWVHVGKDAAQFRSLNGQQ